MAPKRDDAPSIMLIVDRGRIVPAAAIDAETLAGLRDGTELSVTISKTPRSVALRAWWSLMGDVYKHTEFPSPRALSNALLIGCNCYEEELLLNGGKRRTPMSLRDFSEPQLFEMLEWSRLIISRDIIPGVDLEALIAHNRRS